MTKPETSKAIREKPIEDPYTSDKSIADLYGTDNGTVNKIRQQLIYNKIIEDPYYRRGTDGKLYRVRQSKETAKIIRPTGYNEEREIQKQVKQYFSSHNINVETEVICNAGEIDMLTATSLYEVKRTLTRDSLFEAIGQLFMYKQSSQFSGITSIIAGSYEKGVVSLLTHTEKLGIEVLVWEGTKLMPLLKYHKNHYGSTDQEEDQD